MIDYNCYGLDVRSRVTGVPGLPPFGSKRQAQDKLLGGESQILSYQSIVQVLKHVSIKGSRTLMYPCGFQPPTTINYW